MAKPAYVWDGTQWIAFSGPEGKPGPGLNIRGLIDDASKLPVKGDPGDGFITNDDGHLWTWRGATNTWVDSGPFRGPKGDAGETMKISGVVSNAASLPASPVRLTVFMAQDSSHLYIYDPTSGAASAGPTPPVGYVDLGAIAGPAGPTGPAGPIGPQGTAAFFADPVATSLDLPATGTPGEMRLVNNSGHVHSWDSATGTWKDSGLFKQTGSAAHMGHSVATEADLPAVGLPGEVRIVTSTHHMYAWNENSSKWIDAGDFQSIPDGTEDKQVLTWDDTSSAWVAEHVTVHTAADVSKPATLSSGMMLVWDDTNKWYSLQNVNLDLLSDVDTSTTPPVTGQALVFKNGKWAPHSVHSPIMYIGHGLPFAAADWNTTTAPSPATYPPIANDIYFDLDAVTFHRFTGDDGAENTRGAGNATGASLYGDGIEVEDLADVERAVATKPDGAVLIWSATKRKWVPTAAPWAKKTYVDSHVEAISAVNIQTAPIYARLSAAPTVSERVAGRAYVASAVFNVGAPSRADVAIGDVIMYSYDSAGVVSWQVHKPVLNERHTFLDDGKDYRFDGTAWVEIAQGGGSTNQAGQVGDIKHSLLSEVQFKNLLGAEAARWVLADGRNVTGSKYAQVTGSQNVPDLRGSFLRMAGVNGNNPAWNGGNVLSYRDDTTRLPRTTPFATSTSGAGGHSHSFRRWNGNFSGDIKYADSNVSTVKATSGGDQVHAGIDPVGDHTHAISWSGGDAETQPKNTSVNYFICIN
jgi:hypothetical protein